jgi:glc operon protein GlcG
MRLNTLTAGAIGALLLLSSTAFAQAPAAPTNPNDTVPEVMNLPTYGEPITTENAKKVAAAAIQEARRRNWNGLCIAIVGPSGDLIYFEKQDNCQLASPTIAISKASTSARFRRPTLVFERLMAQGAIFAFLPTLGDINAARGGNPLIIGGKVVGAIGVSGGTGSQDDVVAIAGLAALN